MTRSGYCIHCRAKKIIIGGTLKYTSNGKIREIGKCESCKTNISVFVPSKEIKKNNDNKTRQDES